MAPSTRPNGRPSKVVRDDGASDDDDDELNINPPTPCLGKRPQRPKPKGPGRPWGQKPLAHGRTVEGVLHMDPGDLTLHRALLQDHSRPRFPGADGRLPVRSRYGRVYD